MKEKDLKFIKGFSKINVASVCRKVKVDKGNLWNSKTSAENTAKVKNEIMKELLEVLLRSDINE